MSRFSIASVAVVLVLGGAGVSPALAAEPAFVNRVGGYNVTVRRGADDVPVRVQMLLSAGERITAGEESFVEVRYLSDGCILKVANGRSLVVAPSSPCSTSEAVKKAATENAAVETVAAQEAAKPAEGDDVIAQVTSKSGPLARANFGEGLVDIQTGAKLKTGNRVFAGQNSSVTLYYLKANCEFVLSAGQYLEIRDTAPCRQAAAPKQTAPSVSANANLGLAIGTVAVIGGGGALAVLLLTEEDDKPASPD